MPRTHRSVPHILVTPGALRAQALAVLALLQLGVTAALTGGSVLSAAATAPGSLDRAVAYGDQSDAFLAAPVGTPAPAPTAKASTTPLTKARQPKPAAKTARYIPHGTGMWTYQWAETEGGNAKRVVARAKQMGLTHIYVRTGTRKGGFDGAPVLRKLLPATKGTDIKVIAWDFPQLKNPVADARRLAAAAKFTVKGAPRVAAVAPDIETSSEGTVLTTAGVERYMKELRRVLPKSIAIIGVTPWPSEKRVGKYPFAAVARHSDALAPMAYWVNRDPATVARQSMERLRKFRKPIMPIGQAYDPRIDVPTLSYGPPSRADVTEFLAMTARHGAPAASLWVWQFASTGQWQALDAGERMFPKAPK